MNTLNLTILLVAPVALLASSANAALTGILPATPGGTDWQAYYDDQLDITWLGNANVNGSNTWDAQVAWVSNLTVSGVGGWRLPDMDRNNDGVVIDCSVSSQADCQDNELGHLFYYGEGSTLNAGIKPSNPGPFVNVQANDYWSGTDFNLNTTDAWFMGFFGGGQSHINKIDNQKFAWAVHDGRVSPVPLPAAAWLFGSGILGLLGVASRRKNRVDAVEQS